MNTLVVYFSKFGNTQKIAQAISQKLALTGPTQLINATKLKPADFEEVDLVIMGSPTHKMNLPTDVRPVFDRLPKKILKGKYVAAFDTSYKMSWFLNQFTAGKKLVQKLRKLGGRRIISPEIFLVTGREGPLFDHEIERAEAWTNEILEKINPE